MLLIITVMLIWNLFKVTLLLLTTNVNNILLDKYVLTSVVLNNLVNGIIMDLKILESL